MSKWWLLALILVTGLAADQGSKFLAADRLTTALTDVGPGLGQRVRAYYALRHLERHATDPYVVYEPLWRMRYVENPGAAWGVLGDLPVGVRTLFLGVLVMAATAFILRDLRRLEAGQRRRQVALSMFLTGAWGNLLDRLAHGYVVDFVDWHWWRRPDLYWPTFNVADSLLVVGVGLLLLVPGFSRPAPS
jgi:signal peptidase II